MSSDNRRTRGKIGVAVVALAVLVGVSAWAIGRDKSPRSASGSAEARQETGSGMKMGMPAPGPAMMLAHREDLGIDTAQIRHLEALAARQEEEMQRLVPEAMRAMADLMEASGAMNLEAARDAHDRMARMHTDMLVTNLQAMKEARQLLTPYQRTAWQAITAQMGGMMAMMGPLMMGPMKMGSM